jgi:hypothetical protein
LPSLGMRRLSLFLSRHGSSIQPATGGGGGVDLVSSSGEVADPSTTEWIQPSADAGAWIQHEQRQGHQSNQERADLAAAEHPSPCGASLGTWEGQIRWLGYLRGARVRQAQWWRLWWRKGGMVFCRAVWTTYRPKHPYLHASPLAFLLLPTLCRLTPPLAALALRLRPCHSAPPTTSPPLAFSSYGYLKS